MLSKKFFLRQMNKKKRWTYIFILVQQNMICQIVIYTFGHLKRRLLLKLYAVPYQHYTNAIEGYLMY